MASSSSRKRLLEMEDEVDDYSAGIESEINKFMSNPNKSRKHTLDSDSEEEGDDEYNRKKYDVMKDDDIEGQEDGTAEFDGETKITPFNMNDEMEEGYFDGNGMYIWNKKDAGEIKDSWLDSIDWVKIKKNDTGEGAEKKEENDDDSSDDEAGANPIELYKQVVALIQPGESILKGIKRLGGGKTLSASERLKQKKLAKQQGTTVPEESQSGDNKEKMEKLTGLANQIMTLTGNMDVYDETYESLSFKVSEASKPPPAPKEKPKMADDDGSDMFADDFKGDAETA